VEVAGLEPAVACLQGTLAPRDNPQELRPDRPYRAEGRSGNGASCGNRTHLEQLGRLTPDQSANDAKTMELSAGVEPASPALPWRCLTDRPRQQGEWSTRGHSRPQPRAYEARALPLELMVRRRCKSWNEIPGFVKDEERALLAQ
jgi:hypothetical protein